MYQALVSKDAAFEGLFYAGIKTTGIFCRPTCTAKKPKEENVEYFTTTAEALRSGYRPCKICSPLSLSDETPESISRLMADMAANPEMNLSDVVLLERGINPVTLRRWFKKRHGITFHVYKRMLRINFAFRLMQKGETITGTAFSSGFESLSGFAERFKSVTGFTPSAAKEKTQISVLQIPTPIGTMYAGATEKGVCLLEFIDRRMLKTQIEMLAKLLNGVYIYGENRHLSELIKQLREYFAGSLRSFTVALDTPGTPFQRLVWDQLCKIPYGQTRSYSAQASHLGNPKAVRAVARANGQNRIAIVIPCHRVIGESGELIGYGGGLTRKKWLLDLESKFTSAVP